MVHPRSPSPRHTRTHIGACSSDANRRAALARLLLDGSSTLDAAQATIGHGAAIRPAELCVFLAFVMLALHPCHQAASHLACTRPPDFVVSRCSFTGFTPAPSSSSTAIARILIDGSATLDAAEPPKDSGPQAFGGPHQSAELLATSFGGLHPFTCLSTPWPTFLFFRDFLFCIRNFHVRCSRTQTHFWERTASACIIHLRFFCPPPHPFSYCISFLRISLFSSHVHPYVLSIWRDIRSLLLPSYRTFGFPLTSLPAA
jgi:hypothetical protein